MRRPFHRSAPSSVPPIVVPPIVAQPIAATLPPAGPLLAVVQPIAAAVPPAGPPPAELAGPMLAADGGVTPAEVDAADVAVNGPQARSGGLTGAGVKIGIISDSFNLMGGEAADEAAGLLPPGGVTILEDGTEGSDDEGRAIAQLIYATAPGAQLYFYSGFHSEQDMAAGIAALQAAGCQIIVDDVTYSDEPFFQDAGPIDTAVADAVADGVDYFTAIGNDDSGAYQGACTPQTVSISGLGIVSAQTFAGGATTQSVTIQGGYSVTLSLQWDAPYNADNGDSMTVKVLNGSNVIATSTQADNEPVVFVSFPQVAIDRTYTIAILYNAGAPVPTLFKYVLEGGGRINGPAGGEATGSALGQAMLPGVDAVGAVNVADTPAEGGTPTPESFDSTGGSEFLFSADGTALASPEAANGPDFLAPDGAATSVLDPFNGTSAAAPVAAAVAALMLQADAALGNADITTLLEDSALPAGAASVAGAGLIQANLAVQYASTQVISGSPQPTITGLAAACTIQGGAGAHELVAGSGATLIQSQGADTVLAGGGADTVDLTGAAALLYGGTGPTWVRTLGGVDTVIGGAGALTVAGGAGGGVIYGGTAGGDELTAGARQTTMLSEAADDSLVGTGGGDILYASDSGADTLVGGAGNEILVGCGGDGDVFVAGPGNPLIAPQWSAATIEFGGGDATVLGGSGAETFQVVNGQAGGADVIHGFDPTQDLLLLTGFDGEQSAVTAAIDDQSDSAGGSTLTLPDGTVIDFVGLSRFGAADVTYG